MVAKAWEPWLRNVVINEQKALILKLLVTLMLILIPLNLLNPLMDVNCYLKCLHIWSNPV